MNKVKDNGNMYDWVDYTWNPVKGCEHECSYCYLRSMPYFDMTPRFSEKELHARHPAAKRFFVGSSCDLFGAWVPRDWILKTLSMCNDMLATYVLQTKNPGRFLDFAHLLDARFILGTTIESNRDYPISKAPSVSDRALAMSRLPEHITQFVTIEPILKFDCGEFAHMVLSAKPDFVNIGADSKRHELSEPDPKKILRLINVLEQDTEVRLKHNINRLLQQQELNM